MIQSVQTLIPAWIIALAVVAGSLLLYFIVSGILIRMGKKVP